MRAPALLLLVLVAACGASEPLPPRAQRSERSPVARRDAAPAHTVIISSEPTAERSADWLIVAEGCSTRQFGARLAIDRDRLLIAAPAGQVAGDSPAVCTYRRKREGFALDGVLQAANPEASGGFGRAIAVRGSLAVVGAPGSEHPDGTTQVFRRDAERWQRIAELSTPAGKQPREQYGASVAIADGEVLIGAALANVGNKKKIAPHGAVHAFRPLDGGWRHAARLVGASGDAGFGSALAVDGQRLVVGAYRAGTASIYARAASGDWALICRVAGADADELFGASVALSENRVAIGAPHASVRGVIRAGRVDLFTLTPKGCVRNGVLASPSPRVDGRFGHAVALDGPRLVVGEPAIEARGNEARGRVWLYRSDGAAVALERELSSQASRPGDFLGSSVALGPGVVLAGAPREASGYVIASRW